MKKILTLLSAFLVAFSVATAYAGPQTITTTAKAGKKSAIQNFYLFGAGCRKFNGRVSSSKPKHGKVETKRIKVDGSKVRPGDKACANRKLSAVQVYYTPDKGFKGTETLRLKLKYQGFIVHEFRMIIKVR